MAPTICQMIGCSIRDEEDLWTQQLIEGLEAIVDDPRAVIEKQIRAPKLREQALEQLQRQQTHDESKAQVGEPKQFG